MISSINNSVTGRVLLVDDEINILEAIKRYLEVEDLEVITATDGEMALEKYYSESPDLIVLDLMLPKMDGLEVCRTLRAENSAVYIIMLTAKNDDLDKMVGYAMGADSYVTKPFSPKVLVAKIKAALKRVSIQKKTVEVEKEIITIKELKLNNNKKNVKKNGQVIDLTGKEFEILWLLVSHPGQVFSRYQLLEKIWGHDFVGSSDTITVHIRRLREKIEDDASNPAYIKTVWGVGYKFETERED